MTKDEYMTSLQCIVVDGLGFDAIRDLSEMLSIYDKNMLSVMKELNAEKKAIRKIFKGSTSDKEKSEDCIEGDRMKNNKLLHFDIVKCVESGDGFIEGHYYAQVGWNNGINICLLTETGDCEVYIYQTGGAGKGVFSSWDNSGCPSFDPCFFAIDPVCVPHSVYRR